VRTIGSFIASWGVRWVDEEGVVLPIGDGHPRGDVNHLDLRGHIRLGAQAARPALYEAHVRGPRAALG
jgi:hypothetical protein